MKPTIAPVVSMAKMLGLFTGTQLLSVLAGAEPKSLAAVIERG